MGAVDQDRTGDLVITNDVLYQLSYNGLLYKNKGGDQRILNDFYLFCNYAIISFNKKL